MIRSSRSVRSLLVALAALAAPAAGAGDRAGAPPPEPLPLRVMTFNIEYGGTGVDLAKVVEAIAIAHPDVVGLEEAWGNAPAIAAALGFAYVDTRNDVISRHPIVDPPGADGRFVLVEVRPREVVALANVHLPSDPYGPSLVAEGKPLEDVLALENRLRVPKIRPIVGALSGLHGTPAFLVGDFNSPSRADWSRASVGQRSHLRYPVDWPVSAIVQQAGFVDSYRSVHADALQSPGLTWWAARPPVGDDFSHDPQDRIDFVYAAGPARAVQSEIVGEPGAPGVDLAVTPWPSDHRAVVSTFEVTPAPMPLLVAVNGSRLVNAGDPLRVEFHNPGGAGQRIAVVPADAPGDRLPEARIRAAAAVAAARGAVELPTRALSPGLYDAALLSAGNAALARIPFAVKSPADAVEVAVERSVYAPGEAIGVRWRNGPGNRWDWIGVFPAAEEPAEKNMLLWEHTATRNEGRLALDRSIEGNEKWPLPPGEYQVVYLLYDAVRPAARARFSIRAAASPRGAAPASATGSGEGRR